MLDAAVDFMERGNIDQASEVLQKAMGRTRLTIGELRELSFNLEPVVLRDQGLGMAVHALAQDRGIEHGIQVEIDVAAAEALGERRRRSIEVLEERARTLGATLSVEQRDDGTTMRLVLPTYARSD